MPTTTDQQLDQLKQRYQSVFQLMQELNVRLTHVHIQDNKLFVQGDAPSEDVKNSIWDRIKIVNPNWQSDLIADIRVTGTASAPQGTSSQTAQSNRTYTVKPGDTLSKIAKEVYGSANDYMKIFDANKDQLDDPNKIGVGQELKIPS